MEAMLKLLNTQQDFGGTMSDFREVAAKAKKVVAKCPMGRLVDEFLRVVYSSTDPSHEQVSSESSVRFSFRIQANPKFVAERKKALRAVVRERNKLIHEWLASLNTDSVASCASLGAILDEQNDRVRPEIEALRSIVLALLQHQRELAQYLESDAFLAEFEKSITSV
jgi:hypothetical protein